MRWQDVEGWLTEDEGNTLRTLALGKTVLELGAFKGRSTVAMAEVAKLVVSVDWHKGDDRVGHNDTAHEFLANLDACGVREKVVAVVGRIELVATLLAQDRFDLVFIDDDHSEATGRSLDFAMDVVRDRGVIAMHDWSLLGVQIAAEKRGLRPLAIKGDLAWFKVE